MITKPKNKYSIKNETNQKHQKIKERKSSDVGCTILSKKNINMSEIENL